MTAVDLTAGPATVREPVGATSRIPDAAFLWVPFVVLVAGTFASTADDPLITLRYAANVLHGYGPVFNQGQRVEGFTSALHLLVDVVLLALPFGHALLKAKLASLLFGCLAVSQAGRLAQRMVPKGWPLRLTLLLIGGSFVIGFAASNGLETSLACWLVISLLSALVSGRAVSRPVATGVLAGCCVLARPDAALVVGALAAVALVVESTARPLRRVAWVGPSLLVVAASELARVLFFAQALPNTFYAKQAPIATAAHRGLVYLGSLVTIPGSGPRLILSRELALVPVLGLVVGIAFAARHRTVLLYLAAAAGAQILFVLRSGGDWIQGARFIAPVFPALVILEVVGLVRFSARHKDPRIAARWLAGAAALAGVVPSLLLLHTPVWATGGRLDDVSLMQGGGYRQTPMWMTATAMLGCARPGDTVAFSEMGWISWSRQDLNFLDVRGLVNTRIAHDAPSSVRTADGIVDLQWSSPTSVVGATIMQARPQYVLVLEDHVRSNVLGGTYQPVEHRNTTGGHLTLYRRADVVCGGSAHAV